MKADDRRFELEERARALVTTQLVRWDPRADRKAAARCLAVTYTELGENE